MRNPLHYSAELLVKQAAPQPLYIPQYTPQAPQVTMSDSQIADMMKNIQSYPEEQQQKILDIINQNFGQAQYRGGLFGGALGGLGNYGGAAIDKLQAGINWASQGLFGRKPFDTQDSDRYRAETVLQTAAQNPELYKKVTEGLQGAGIGAKQQAPAAAPSAPAAPTTASNTGATPTTANTGNAAAVAKKVLEGGYAPGTPKPGPMLPKLVSTAYAAKSSPAAAQPAPKKEGLIDGRPASQWIAQNKARQKDEDAGRIKASPAKPVVNTNPNAGLRYNATTGQYHPPGYNMYAGKVI